MHVPIFTISQCVHVDLFHIIWMNTIDSCVCYSSSECGRTHFIDKVSTMLINLEFYAYFAHYVLRSVPLFISLIVWICVHNIGLDAIHEIQFWKSDFSHPKSIGFSCMSNCHLSAKPSISFYAFHMYHCAFAIWNTFGSFDWKQATLTKRRMVLSLWECSRPAEPEPSLSISLQNPGVSFPRLVVSMMQLEIV